MNYFVKIISTLALFASITNVIATNNKNWRKSTCDFVQNSWTDLITGRKTINAKDENGNLIGGRIHKQNKNTISLRDKVVMINRNTTSEDIVFDGKVGRMYDVVEPSKENVTIYVQTGKRVYIPNDQMPTDSTSKQSNENNKQSSEENQNSDENLVNPIVEIETYTTFGWLNNTTQQVVAAAAITGLLVWNRDYVLNSLTKFYEYLKTDSSNEKE